MLVPKTLTKSVRYKKNELKYTIYSSESSMKLKNEFGRIKTKMIKLEILLSGVILRRKYSDNFFQFVAVLRFIGGRYQIICIIHLLAKELSSKESLLRIARRGLGWIFYWR